MKSLTTIMILAVSATAFADSVYELKDASGGTVYSDRPTLPGTTEVGKVELAPGPSAEERQRAEQRVQKMQNDSEEMRRTRLDNEKRRRTEKKERSNTDVSEIDSYDGGVNVDNNRHDLKERIPLESRDGGEHRIYKPRDGNPIHIQPRPRPMARHK